MYRVSLVGGEPREVLPDVDSPVSFSPDGRQIAFVRGYPERRENALVVAASDGSSERVLAVRKAPGDFSAEGCSWHPAGDITACGHSDRATAYVNHRDIC